MRKETTQWVSEKLTDAELVRIADLVMRRMIDNGVDNYEKKDVKIFEKMGMIKERARRNDFRLCMNLSECWKV